MNKRSIQIVVCLFLTFAISSLKSQDHLEPVDGIFDLSSFEFEYHSKVRQVLFEGLTEHPAIRFQVMPSFMPESVLDIEWDKNTEKYILVYHEGDRMIWDNKKWKKTKIIAYRSVIDKASATLVQTLFEKVIKQTKIPKDEQAIGFDGAVYYFSRPQTGLPSGKIWSPIAGSKMDKLVDVGLQLVQLAKSKNETISFDQNFRNEIQQLIEALD